MNRDDIHLLPGKGNTEGKKGRQSLSNLVKSMKAERS